MRDNIFRPILRFRSTRPGVDGEDAITFVVRAVQESAQFKIIEIGENFFNVRRHLGFELQLHRFRLGGGEFEHDLQIVSLLAEARERIEFAADVVRFVDDFLRGFLIVPKSFAGHLRFEFGEALFNLGDVKETSASA